MVVTGGEGRFDAIFGTECCELVDVAFIRLFRDGVAFFMPSKVLGREKIDPSTPPRSVKRELRESPPPDEVIVLQ